MSLAVLALAPRVLSGQQAAIIARGAAMVPVVVHEIQDPATGARWLLERDPAHPAGPGRLVEVSSSQKVATAATETAPVIHAGDRVVVEQHTEVADGRFEATALGSAAKGAVLRVRMRSMGEAGGLVVLVHAIDAGRAELAAPHVATSAGAEMGNRE